MRRTRREDTTTRNGTCSESEQGQRAPIKDIVCTLTIAVAIFGLVPLLASYVAQPERSDLEWWKTSVMYGIDVKSFKDSDGDGFGDLQGIISSLGYLNSLGIDSLWLDPVFASDDSGSVVDFNKIDPVIGDMNDFKELTKAVHDQGLHLIVDFIPNHTSNKHKWFVASHGSQHPTHHTHYYVWHDGTLDSSGTRSPPNNWVSEDGESAWSFDEVRQQFYLHQFDRHQPDLNWRNKEVQQEMQDILTFWVKAGVDGFHMKHFSKLTESHDLQTNESPLHDDQYGVVRPSFTHHQPDTYNIAASLRSHLDAVSNQSPLLLVDVEGPADNIDLWQGYYHHGPDMPTNHFLSQVLNSNCDGWCLNHTVMRVIQATPKKGWTNWAVGDASTPRMASRMGRNHINIANMLNLMLPGTAVTYYGDELGLMDTCQDENKVTSGNKCRTSMPWQPDTGSPSISGSTMDVETQTKNPSSPLSKYKELVKLRSKPVLQWGKLLPVIVNDNIYSYLRYAIGRFYNRYLIAMNIGTTSFSNNYVMKVGGIKIPSNATLIFSTVTSDSLSLNNILDLTDVDLKPGEGFIVEFPSNAF